MLSWSVCGLEYILLVELCVIVYKFWVLYVPFIHTKIVVFYVGSVHFHAGNAFVREWLHLNVPYCVFVRLAFNINVSRSYC